jgi:hypothetical protein
VHGWGKDSNSHCSRETLKRGLMLDNDALLGTRIK